MSRIESEENEARLRVDDWNGDRPPRSQAHQGAREPAPGDANPLSKPEQRPNDQREEAL